MTSYAEDLRQYVFVSIVADPDPTDANDWVPIAPFGTATARFTPTTATPMTFGAAAVYDSTTFGEATGYGSGQTWGGVILYCRRGSNPTGTLTISGGDFGGPDASVTINATDLPVAWRWCLFLLGSGTSGATATVYVTTTDANQIEIIGNGTNFYAGGYTLPWVGGAPVGNGDMQSLVACGTLTGAGTHVEHTPTTNTTGHANTRVDYGIWGVDPDTPVPAPQRARPFFGGAR
jgi:hypothetical protein